MILKCHYVTVADLDGKAGGEIMASAERELIMGFGGFAPIVVQGQSSWLGETLLKLNVFL